MKQIVSNLPLTVFVSAGLLLAGASTFAQTRSGSPLSGQNRYASKYGMSPYMKPDGPMAPENNAAFAEQHVSETIRENMAMEIELSRLALTHSKNPAIEKFARRVIAENRVVGDDAKQFAPDKSGTFPNPMFEGTRQAVNARVAEKKMKKLTGQQFDRLYLVQMNSYTENDQQVGHSTYAMMQFPGVSPVGRKMWDMANDRAVQIAALGRKLHAKLEQR